MIYFSIKYNKNKNPKAEPTVDSTSLEITWFVVPTILVLVMFYYGWVGYEPMLNIPDNAIPVKTTGKMWSWSFEYENGKWSDILVVPINKAVKLDLVSEDVLHSFFVPAFRIKRDVVPGIDNKMWFEATELGTYNILCAEYCGTQHSSMISEVKVLTQDEWEKWYNTKETVKTGSSAGKELLKKHGCIACHSTDGSKIIGPSFKGIYNSERFVLEGDNRRKIKAGDEYIKNSILNPKTQIVEGYPDVMLDYKGKINPEEINDIIEYLKTLK
jgi:cytochrome c oxidase subunit 2